MFTQEIRKAEEGYARSKIPWESLDGYLALLEYHAARNPTRPSYRFHGTDGALIEWSFVKTLEMAARFGAVLLAAGAKPGDRVGVWLDTSPQFLMAYFGTMYAGCIPVCVAGNVQKTAAVLADCQASFAVVEPALFSVESELRKLAPSLKKIFVVDLDEKTAPIKRHYGRREDIAIIQYTSGSTSRPQVSSRNVRIPGCTARAASGLCCRRISSMRNAPITRSLRSR